MKAYEFQTHINQGIVEIPKNYLEQLQNYQKVRVIILTEDENYPQTLAVSNDIKAAVEENVTIRKANEYGTHYNMKFRLKTQGGESLILAGWIICQGEDFPRLTNCYPIKN